MEFHYRHWTDFGPGSSVTFAGGAGLMEVTASLQERDAEKVVLLIRCALGRRSLDFSEILRARSSSDVRPIREGREVIVVAGEEWLSRWVETGTVKSWFVDHVPGGIARWQTLEPKPLTWTVKAFRRA